MNYVIITLLLVFASATQAQVYKCIVDGVTKFSQKPCDDDAEPYEVKHSQPLVNQVEQARTGQPNLYNAQSTGNRTELEERRISILKRNLNIELVRLDARKSRLTEQRNSDLARVRAQKNRAANNLAGAVWEDSLSSEMSAINQRYDSDIREINREIDSIKDKLKDLN